MKHLLIGINAKYIHSNLAIRSIAQYAMEHFGLHLHCEEYTINQPVSLILSEIYKQMPDTIGFSCYIWNYGLICRLTDELKKVLPNCAIYFGGPEVSYNAKEVLESSSADYVICGEGEAAVPRFLLALMQNTPLFEIENLVYRTIDEIHTNAQAPLMPMDEIPFVYSDLSDLAHKIIYYESSRGCPFQCQYCLSCIDAGVRMMSLPRVFKHLDFFLAHRVRQVKFVDRTFNCDKSYAMAIWQYLKEHDNGYTNFHFEIAAELLDEEILAFLPSVRKGYFQFEIGVQSTNPATLKAIRRFTQIDKLRTIVAKLQSGNNIHLHLDLIIGLPYEGYTRFGTSFNDVYALKPDQLQVGFLKLLKGSGLYENRDYFHLVSSDYPPYEILYTDCLSYQELLKLKMIEEMVEIYYNSNRFQCLLQYLIPFFPSAFLFFEALSRYFESQQLHLRAHTNTGYYTILWEFAQTLSIDKTSFQVYALFDLYSHEKVKKLPDWLTEQSDTTLKKQVFDFYNDSKNIVAFLPEYQQLDTKQIIRQAHLLTLPFDPITHLPEPCYYLFNYKRVDLLGNAHFEKVPDEMMKGAIDGKPEPRSFTE